MKIITFSGEWCKPCKQFAPTFKKIIEHYNFSDVINVDVDDDESGFVKQFNIKSVPTTLLIDESGMEVERLGGNLSFDYITKKIDKYFY